MKAQISIFSRCHSRRAQYSTIQVRRALIKAGFEEGLRSHKTALVQDVELSGTRDELIRDRATIDRMMHIIAGPLARDAQSFKLLES